MRHYHDEKLAFLVEAAFATKPSLKGQEFIRLYNNRKGLHGIFSAADNAPLFTPQRYFRRDDAQAVLALANAPQAAQGAV